MNKTNNDDESDIDSLKDALLHQTVLNLIAEIRAKTTLPDGMKWVGQRIKYSNRNTGRACISCMLNYKGIKIENALQISIPDDYNPSANKRDKRVKKLNLVELTACMDIVIPEMARYKKYRCINVAVAEHMGNPTCAHIRIGAKNNPEIKPQLVTIPINSNTPDYIARRIKTKIANIADDIKCKKRKDVVRSTKDGFIKMIADELNVTPATLMKSVHASWDHPYRREFICNAERVIGAKVTLPYFTGWITESNLQDILQIKKLTGMHKKKPKI